MAKVYVAQVKDHDSGDVYVMGADSKEMSYTSIGINVHTTTELVYIAENTRETGEHKIHSEIAVRENLLHLPSSWYIFLLQLSTNSLSGDDVALHAEEMI